MCTDYVGEITMRLFDLNKPEDKKELGTELEMVAKAPFTGEGRTLINWQLKYAKELMKTGCQDKVLIYGRTDKFVERMTQPSPVQLREIYDVEDDVKKIKAADYEVVGGLGGFTFNNGKNAGELIYLPGGSPMRAHIDNGKHIAMMVAPINIYPLCVITARKKAQGKSERIFIALLDNGDSITQPLEKIEKLVGNSKKTVTGIISGSFSNITGYIFMKASPQTVLKNFELKENKALFLYQTLLADNITGFERIIHTHGFEAARFGEPYAFGAHIDTAKAEGIAMGIFVVTDNIERKI